MNGPLVSAIMPTRNRRRFVEQSIGLFLSQDWPNRELVIVDDGEPVRDLIPDSTMFSYVHLGDVHKTIGAKRNIACGMARGEYVCHWDDDDFSGPGRISEQVRVLKQSARPATGYNQLPFAWDEGRRAWLYLGRPGYACGTSLMYLRAYWAGHRFRDLQIGEDNEFIEKLGDRFISSSGRQMVARIHGDATCQKVTMLTGSAWTGARGQSWQEIQYEQLAQCGYPVVGAREQQPEDDAIRNSEDCGGMLVLAHASGEPDCDAVHASGDTRAARHSGIGHRKPAVSRRKRRAEAQRG